MALTPAAISVVKAFRPAVLAKARLLLLKGSFSRKNVIGNW
jgi:hypothetical protein